MKTAIVPSLLEEDRDDLINRVPRESSAKDRHCVSCPIKRGSPRLPPCCLCCNRCHFGCSYQTHLGRVCPCHVRILDPKRKIMVLRHPYHEDCGVLPTRTTMRVDDKSIAQEARCRTQPDDTSLSRWSPASWLNTLLEKHAWLSAGLVWVQGASMSANSGVFDEPPSGDSEPRPTINLFEQWEEGAHMTKVVT